MPTVYREMKEKEREREREGERGRGRGGGRERESDEMTQSFRHHAPYHEYFLEVALLHPECFMLASPQCSHGVDLAELESGDGPWAILHVLLSVIDQQPLGGERHHHEL